MPYAQLGRLYSGWEKYDQAIEFYSQALEIAPLDQEVINAIAWTHLKAGNLEQAASYWSMYNELESQFADMSQYVPFRHRLGYINWLEGNQDRARELFEEQMQLDLERQQGLRGFGAWSNGSHFYDLAAVNAFLGNREEALAWLDSATAKGFTGLRIIQDDPLFDNLKDDPKYRRMIRSMKEEDEKTIRAFKEILKERKEVIPSV
jgi:tetratricopeptide (TPR) repeat protein